ncbi:MAG: heavy-metal-associated domain-containing protein [Caldimonas sp.]
MFDFKIPDMSCGHCVGVITTTVKSLDPRAEVSTDLPSHTVRVESTATREARAAALAEAGYAPA